MITVVTVDILLMCECHCPKGLLFRSLLFVWQIGGGPMGTRTPNLRNANPTL